MEQDVNKIISNVSAEWASGAIEDKKRLAILVEENERLKRENESLKANEKDSKSE